MDTINESAIDLSNLQKMLIATTKPHFESWK
jgi:hypothetical protein